LILGKFEGGGGLGVEGRHIKTGRASKMDVEWG